MLFFNNNRKDTAVYAPMSGQFISLAQVDDPVFSSGSLGHGFAIRSNSGDVRTPIAGMVSSIFPTNQALIIRTPDERDVLIHFGVGQEHLKRERFSLDVRIGEKVDFGDRLELIDTSRLDQEKGIPTIVVVSTDFKFHPDLGYGIQVDPKMMVGTFTAVK
ncbi:PTS sugar transporter subunit IIA [Companilactobacillus mishanensis]|uniref:PTS glucose transporter subunit IIA n=1 Tax=Companilactobacillus mishanensis TaxID=2486008 RepID=A0ABW9P6X5_9LACO|nr:PTS glucose transporter subunit IIA [Companilactobacillus mishanensis]MQS44922.1 PTS glucose transporter subunit IIA [Companilactobacillus mishanensis]